MELSYAAGLFDGEGTIGVDVAYIDRPSKPYTRSQLRVAITMTHLPTIQLFHTQFGGSISRCDSANRRNKNHRIVYTWLVWSNLAANFLRDILPYLITKKEEAILAIEFQDHIRSSVLHFRKYRGNPPDIDDIHSYRYHLIKEIKKLKKKGYDVPKEKLIYPIINDGPVSPSLSN